ncbi:conjugative transposon protein TraM [Flavobacterium oreochromis]|uniref:conjugative transposon protein TraM n=1 Tax=Flavobacterium oreochromis TaxID=2906078 RepID=UPI00385E5981
MEETNKNNDEKKRKYIFYGIIGVLILAVVGYGIADVSNSSEENPEKIEEIGTPESELDKYNSKVDAVGANEKQKNTPNSSLMDVYDTSKEDERKKKEDEELRNLEKQLQNVGKDNNNSNYSNSSDYEENRPIRASKRRNYNYSNSRSYATEGEKYKPEINYYPTNENKPVQKNIVTVPGPDLKEEKKIVSEEKVNRKSNSGFFKKTATSKVSKGQEQYYACVHTDQTVMDGNRIKLRLIKEANINGDIYPINTIIYGLVRIRPNRLLVTVNKINQTEVDLCLFDAEDSNEGMYVVTPNLNASLKKELNKEVIDDDDLSRIPFSKSLKSIFSKKVKEERITLLNNYKIIIKKNPKKDEI